MSRERAKEAFAHCDPGYEAPKDPPADVSFGEGIRDMTISIYANILETAREICGREGVCADSPCNEKNVGQNIAGKSDHAEDV